LKREGKKGYPLFRNLKEKERPLAERLRPGDWNEVFGQEHLTSEGSAFRLGLKNYPPPSIILWGPPGSGKTTIAEIIAKGMSANVFRFSAVLVGIREVKDVMEEARFAYNTSRRVTVVFLDEIHRFNKAQQDAFLPFVEKGDIMLIGATTENPSFSIISPLLSRCMVAVLKPLDEDAIKRIILRAMEDENGLKGYNISIGDDALNAIIELAHCDARAGLNILELSVVTAKSKGKSAVDIDTVKEVTQKRAILYDKKGEEHYNIISAFIKSLIGSDPDAALYWLARLLEGGEDPLFILRRMMIFSAEDIGMADPNAILVATAASYAFERVGMPEGWIPIAFATVYLATAPKSNSSYLGYINAKGDVDKFGPLGVPLHLRNAPTKFMESLGYGRGYKYPHNFEGHYVKEDYLPEKIKGKRYYTPSKQGFEKDISERMKKR